MMTKEKWGNLWDAFRENNRQQSGRDLNPFAVGTGYEDLQKQKVSDVVAMPQEQPPMQPPQTMPIAPPQVQSQAQPPSPQGVQQAMPNAQIGQTGVEDLIKANLGSLEEEPETMPPDVAMMFMPPWMQQFMGGFKPSDAPNTKYMTGGGF